MPSRYGKFCLSFILSVGACLLCSATAQKSTEEDASQSEEPVYELGPDVTPPRVIKQVNPKYSESSRGVRVTGSITIGVIISSQGTPKDPRVIRGIEDEVDRAAVEALKQWRFAPARRKDKAVAVRVVVEIAFHGM
jgi:TonB family protein